MTKKGEDKIVNGALAVIGLGLLCVLFPPVGAVVVASASAVGSAATTVATTGVKMYLTGKGVGIL